MLEQLKEYFLARIKSYPDEKQGELFYGQCSQQYTDPNDGLIEIKAPRKYKGKKRLERRLKTAVIEFYSKQGFELKEPDKGNKKGGLYFERKINSLEKYLVSIERQGIFFYIHVLKK